MDPSEDTAVQDFLEILEEHRKNCERQGDDDDDDDDNIMNDGDEDDDE
jgi:hypothetical protein